MTSQIFVLIEHIQENVTDMTYMMLAAARSVADDVGGEVVGVLLGQDAQALLANAAADRVIYIEHPALEYFSPEAYQIALTELINQNPPRLFMLGETSIGADIAGGLSARTDIPLISMCRSIQASGDDLRYVSQICGGKILAEGSIPGPTCLVTMVPGEYKVEAGQSNAAPPLENFAPPEFDALRETHQSFIKPEVGDVDIAREPVLVAVGRGIQQEMNLEYAEDLAEQLDAVICASRPVVDQGWLDTSRLVGKSGKRVSPKIYLSIGISGAPEHAEGIGDVEMFIAINTDPQAPIFDLADYGAAADLFELVPALTEKLRAAKGG